MQGPPGRRHLEWYRWRLELFSRHVGAGLTADALKHFHIDEWLAKNTEWSSVTKHGMARAVQRAVRWALKLPGLAFSKSATGFFST